MRPRGAGMFCASSSPPVSAMPALAPATASVFRNSRRDFAASTVGLFSKTEMKCRLLMVIDFFLSISAKQIHKRLQQWNLLGIRFFWRTSTAAQNAPVRHHYFFESANGLA